MNDHRHLAAASLLAIMCNALIVGNTQQTPAPDAKRTPITCAQPDEERNVLIEEADKEGYLFRFLGFEGNDNIRDVTLRRRIIFNEGDRFTRKILQDSLASLGKVRIIEKVTLANVVITLNRQDKWVDMIICVTDKRLKKAR